MKTITKIIAVVFLIVAPIVLSAQPHPYDSGIGGGVGSNPVGGGAPITGGLLIMLSLAAGYGIKKVYEYRERLSE